MPRRPTGTWPAVAGVARRTTTGAMASQAGVAQAGGASEVSSGAWSANHKRSWGRYIARPVVDAFNSPLRRQALAHTRRGRTVHTAQPAAQVADRVVQNVAPRSLQRLANDRQIVVAWLIGAAHVEPLPQQAEARVARDVVGHRRHVGCEALEVLHAA